MVEEKDEEVSGSWKKCRNPVVDSGLLHDTMALEWGKFRGLVNELTYTMEQNHATFTRESDNLNEQIKFARSDDSTRTCWMRQSLTSTRWSGTKET